MLKETSAAKSVITLADADNIISEQLILCIHNIQSTQCAHSDPHSDPPPIHGFREKLGTLPIFQNLANFWMSSSEQFFWAFRYLGWLQFLPQL
jgi:hypothetical protein